MSIADTNSFSFEEVTIELGVPFTEEYLTYCFAVADPAKFDPTYEGNKDRLSNFRNYGGVTSTSYYLTLSSSVNGVITVGNSGYYNVGGIIYIDCQPNENYSFAYWGGNTANVDNINSKNTYITMPSSDISVTAYFSENSKYTLTLTANIGGSITQGTSGDYYEGDVINIAASADSGYEFSNWSEDTAYVNDVNSISTYITMPASNISVAANFDETVTPVGEYGLLYTSYTTNTSKDIAPSGTRVPSESDYNTLINYISSDYVGTVNDALKSTYDWSNFDNGNDIYGFTALPSGRRTYVGSYSDYGTSLDAWTTTWSDSNPDQRIYFNIDSGSDIPDLYRFGNLNAGMALRCMRDLTSTEISNNVDGDVVEIITDYDGNSYGLIKIGDQGWLNTNLQVKHFTDGTAIPGNLTNTEWENNTGPAWAVPQA